MHNHLLFDKIHMIDQIATYNLNIYFVVVTFHHLMQMEKILLLHYIHHHMPIHHFYDVLVSSNLNL